MSITLSEVKRIGDALGVKFVKNSGLHNINGITPKVLRQGILVELEHGYKYAKYGINITNDDHVKCAKIALAHLIEFPDYYERLAKLETQADKWWKGRIKPQIF